MNNKQLAEKLEQWAYSLAETGGKSWVLSVPVRVDIDPDCLMVEAAKRLRDQSEAIRLLKNFVLACRKYNDDMLVHEHEAACTFLETLNEI